MRIRTQCRACGLPFTTRIDRGTTHVACPGCGEARSVALAGWSEADERRVDSCLLCECRHLYRQRDVNRALGCLLVAIGAALVPWTYGLSLILLAGFDLILYYRLPESVVCYRCDAVYRDARPGPRQTEFDLLKHDVLKYGKSWQDLPKEDLEPDDVPGAATSGATQRVALEDSVEHRRDGMKGGD